MTAEPSSPEAPEAAAKPKGGLGGKLLIAGFMGGVVALECLIAYLVFPSPEEVAALAQKKIETQLPATMAGTTSDLAAEETEAVAEIDLGEYSITVSQPNSSLALRVDFHMWGTVLEEDIQDIKALMDRHIHRFRDQVLVEIRNSEPADLADPGLALIKRRILEKSNRLFGEPMLRSVIFSQFSYIEQ
jgi:flagellar FliL protein